VSEERDYEVEAKEQGWNPDFDGPNKTDAKTFVEKGEQIAGMATARNKRLEERVNQLEQANQKFGEYHKATLARQERQAKETIAELEVKLEQAINDGDGQEFTRVNREIDSIKAEAPPPDDQQAWANMAQSWAVDNQWYNTNPKLQAYADGISDQLRAKGYNGQAYFSELTNNVKETFPEEFKNPKREAANAVESGGTVSTTNSKAQTYDNLPDDAKRACDDFVSQGFVTQEDYVKTYEWEA